MTSISETNETHDHLEAETAEQAAALEQTTSLDANAEEEEAEDEEADADSSDDEEIVEDEA